MILSQTLDVTLTATYLKQSPRVILRGLSRTLLLVHGTIVLFILSRLSFFTSIPICAWTLDISLFITCVPHTESSPLLLLHMWNSCCSLMGYFWPWFLVVLLPSSLHWVSIRLCRHHWFYKADDPLYPDINVVPPMPPAQPRQLSPTAPSTSYPIPPSIGSFLSQPSRSVPRPPRSSPQTAFLTLILLHLQVRPFHLDSTNLLSLTNLHLDYKSLVSIVFTSRHEALINDSLK